MSFLRRVLSAPGCGRLVSWLLAAVFCACPAWVRAQTFTVTPERASAIYIPGETIRWEVAVAGSATMGSPKYKVKSGGLDVPSWTPLTLTNGKATVSTMAGTTPGWVLLEVQGTNTSSATVTGYGGALISPEQITPASTAPADFDAFWVDKLAQLAAVPMNAVVTPGTATRSGVEYSLVTMDNINGTHIRGQLARPTSGTKFPAVVIFQWAGVYGLEKDWVEWRAANGWLALNIQAHDIAVTESASYYTDLDKGALSGYYRIGNEDRETSYFLRMYLACHRAVEYLATRDDWDGRTIVVTGASQGGQQSLVAAALNPRVTAVVAEVPAGSDQWGPDAGRLASFPTQLSQAWDRDLAKVRQACLYFDVVHFAPKIHCPTLIGAGLIDTVVPPPGLYASYNQIPGGKEIVPMPKADHQVGHDAYSTRATAWLNEIKAAQPPTIATGPVSASTYVGRSVEFSVAASGGTVYSYQWKRDGVAIAGATTDRLQVTEPAVGSFSYTVEVRSLGGSVESAPAVLTVTKPTLTVRADDKAKVVGAVNPALSCTYSGWLDGDSVASLAELPTLSTPATTASPVGTYPITLSGGADETYALVLEPGTLTVVASAVAPTVETPPAGVTATAGRGARFSVAANSTVTLAYQWEYSADGGASWGAASEGPEFIGTETSTLTVRTAPLAMHGYQFRCVISDGANPAVTSAVAALAVKWSQFSALSARAPAGTGEQTLILGFVFAGGGKPTLVRGVGPGISTVSGYMMDPQLRVYTSGSVEVASNDDWPGSQELMDAFVQTGAGALDPASKDAALLQNLTGNVYTAHVSGANGTTGVALAEAYDADFSDKTKRLTALSVRNQVGVDDAILIAGFVIAGDAPKQVIVRGVGPGISTVNGYLRDPQLQVWKLNTVTGKWTLSGENDDWDHTPETAALFQSAGMGALGSDSKDAALVLTLEPGIYTAQVAGVGRTTGVGVVEIYEAP